MEQIDFKKIIKIFRLCLKLAEFILSVISRMYPNCEFLDTIIKLMSMIYRFMDIITFISDLVKTLRRNPEKNPEDLTRFPHKSLCQVKQKWLHTSCKAVSLSLQTCDILGQIPFLKIPNWVL